MKFRYLVASLIGCCSASLAHASEGPTLEVGLALDQDLSVVAEFAQKYRVTIGNDGAAFDYIFQRGQFQTEAPLSWYVGAGAWADWHDDFGLRLPLGVKANFYEGWNVYAQIHPELDMYKGLELQVGGALGVTYKF
ncbi:hypothetical protein [uncultured Vibrio sp.]|uniref:hypothetical protein n=1 Tax=uncultured Vibrio sp. TaxID=114054 RepID=UPI00261619A4|nr:hypothetical protein [uncultured Vibrio sp.]